MEVIKKEEIERVREREREREDERGTERQRETENELITLLGSKIRI